MNSLRSLGRAIDYEIERQIGAIEVGRADRAGDPPLGRGRRPHALDAHEGRLVRLPLLPRARPRAGRAHRRDARRACGESMPELPAARRARLVAGVGDRRRRRPGARRHARAGRLRRSGRASRSIGGTATRRRQLVRPATCSRTSTRRGCRPRCCRSRPTVSPSSSASSPTARSRAARPRTCSPSASREPKRPKQVVAERGLVAGERRRRARRGRRRHPRRQRRRRRRVPRRRRQGPQEEARLPHGRGDEGAPRARATPRCSTSSSTEKLASG